MVLSTVPGFAIKLSSGNGANAQSTTNYFNLVANTSHTFLVKNSTDSDTSYVAISTYTLSKSPGFTGFQMFTTSATVFLVNNGNPVGSTTTYRVQVSTDGFSAIAFSSQGVNGSDAAAPTLTVFGLQANSTYQIGIDALNFVNLASSRTVVATTSTLAAIPPSFAILTSSDVGISSVAVSWAGGINPLTPPTSYQLQISTDINFGVFIASETFLTNVSTAALSANTSYYFRVRAYGRGGDTSAFNTVIATFTRTASPGFTGFQMFTTSATVNLSANSNPSGTIYRVQVSTDGFSSIAFSSQGIVTILTAFGLQANSTYQVGIDALNFVNLSSSRTVVASTSTLAAIPGAISFIGVSGTSITVTWGTNGNPLTPPTSYQVQISTWNGFDGTITSSVTFLVQASSSGLIPNSNYFFRVRAFGVGGDTSAFNAEISTLTTAPNTPTALRVTAIATDSISFAWTDNSNNEEGFWVLNSTNGLYGSASANATSLAISGFTPNTLVTARIAAFNTGGASTGSITISSYTLANPPGTPTFISGTRTQVTISWSSNTNPSSVPYEVSQSTDNFVFAAGISTPIAFSSNLTSTSTIVAGLTAGGTYYFRVRARNGASVVTAFSASITTVTPAAEVIQSTGGTVDAGGTTVTAELGVTITNRTLADGSTQQTLISTQTATVTYGSGIALQLPAGLQCEVIASADSIQLTSTGTIPISNSGFTIEATSGTLTVQSSADTLTVSLATDAPQNVQTTIPTTGAKTVAIALNPPSGEIKTSIPPGALTEQVKLRCKLPDTFPSITAAIRQAQDFALRASPAVRSLAESELLTALPFGAPATLKGFGIGVEILLDKSVKPSKLVPITMKYRESDISGTNTETLVVGRFEETIQKWVTLPTSVNASARSVMGTTNHFSKFQLMAMTPATNVNDVKVFPNPLRTYKGQTDMTFTNISAEAAIKIYTYAGELVKELKADATGTVRWDAKNYAGEKVSSGIYLALIEGAQASQKVIKIAVER